MFVTLPRATAARTDMRMTNTTARLHDRREFLAFFSSIGLGSTLLPGVLWAKVASGAEITKETIASAEEIAGMSFTDDERAMMVRNLTQTRAAIDALHKTTLENSVAPALVFDPVPPGVELATKQKKPAARSRVTLMGGRRPASSDLAFLPVTQLS
jgi:hypothetical protein